MGRAKGRVDEEPTPEPYQSVEASMGHSLLERERLSFFLYFPRGKYRHNLGSGNHFRISFHWLYDAFHW